MTYFADTFYFLALLNTHDPAHRRARAVAEGRAGDVLTTHYVLLELADGLCDQRHRAMVANMIGQLRTRPDIRIVPGDQKLFGAALNLYARRPDKDWSLTDCTSFVVMQELGLGEALTGDHHFEQAGFVALLK